MTASAGIFIESALLVPLALLILLVGGWLGWSFGSSGSTAMPFSQVLADPLTGWLLLGAGPATALPLILFGVAAKRLPLTTLGLMQYIAPSLQFLIAIFVLNEPLNGVRLLTFLMIWLALALVSLEAILTTGSKSEPDAG